MRPLLAPQLPSPHSCDGPGVTAPLRTNIVPLTAVWNPPFPYPPFWERKKHINKKTRKQNFHGIVPGFLGDFCLCVFFSPIRNDPKKTHKQIFGTQPVPGQSREFVYVYVFFLFLTFNKSAILNPCLIESRPTVRKQRFTEPR